MSVALATVLGVYSWYRRSVPGARAFAIGCLLATLWALGSCLEIAAVDFPTKVFWLQFHALWQIPMVTDLCCFFLQYAGLGRFLTRRNLVLFAIPAVLVFGLMVTNRYHHLIWTSFRLEGSVLVEYGIGTWASIWYANLLGLVNFVALVRLAVGSRRSRWPVALMLFGQISGRAMYLLDSLNNRIFSPGESVLVVVGLSCSVYAFAFFYFRVLDPIPLARSVVIEQMSDGMLVLGLSGNVVDVNPATAAIFGESASALRGRAVADVMPVEAGIAVRDGQLTLARSEIGIGSGDAARYYSLGLTHLQDARGEALGHLLLLHDMTGQRRSQELFLEQQRALATLQEREHLARELHDSLGQVLGYISMQAQTARKSASEGESGKAVPILGRLAEVAQEAHADVRESILGLRNGMASEWNFFAALRKYLEHYRSAYGIDTELRIPEALGEKTLNPDVGVQVLRVIQSGAGLRIIHGSQRESPLQRDRASERRRAHRFPEHLGDRRQRERTSRHHQPWR